MEYLNGILFHKSESANNQLNYQSISSDSIHDRGIILFLYFYIAVDFLLIQINVYYISS